MVDGKATKARPHDLRRTCARRLHEAGVDLATIQQNLGRSTTATTLGYIGELGAERRRAPGIYRFYLNGLTSQAAMELGG